MTKVVLDTNLYVDWLNRGRRPEVMLGPGRVRYLSAVVLMELRVGATTPAATRAVMQLTRGYASGGRLVAPDARSFGLAGEALQRMRARGQEVRRASLVNDLLIALTARSIGAAVLTADADFRVIADVTDTRLELVPA